MPRNTRSFILDFSISWTVHHPYTTSLVILWKMFYYLCFCAFYGVQAGKEPTSHHHPYIHDYAKQPCLRHRILYIAKVYIIVRWRISEHRQKVFDALFLSFYKLRLLVVSLWFHCEKANFVKFYLLKFLIPTFTAIHKCFVCKYCTPYGKASPVSSVSSPRLLSSPAVTGTSGLWRIQSGLAR